ncbi:DEAD/H associated domain protein [Chthoniobacter flavus Ellin428]|uniref:DEAD/H associated domain protein n=1 Tax=Chthoniobacter flavus Ellin428 TaxID=497964 RepID=B4D6Q0_9BACT|nr:DEAD/DEAH box helicase [Chthoniobacter flavus]EDY17851.1 DEAD/H associated domain protein [Chthoniobacter flavus Ellin428]
MPVESSASPSAFAWFADRYGTPTPAQEAAWPRIARGENILLASPTGTGKTFAAFLGVLDELVQLHARGELRDAIHCVYVSPLRALSYDLEKNLLEPLRELYGDQPPIRVQLRTGDTTSSERARQYTKPPHFLLTTPESLCVLLSQERWLVHLSRVRWLIVDEIHALAENKRGAHLALSIERLAHHCGQLQRIGLSATIAPLDEVARFLVGTHGTCATLDVSSSKKVKLSVHTPLRKNPYPEAGYTGQRMIRELGDLIRKHQTTLVFCNVRSGAEATTYWLRENFPDLADVIECHHASLERDVRRDVEDRLKRGELRAVVCSTSLELGIDIGSVDLVVMMSTPKGVSKALQRAGRAGHNIRSISRGILMATNISDLVESCATVLLSRARQLDNVRMPESPLDVLAQHVVSMGCTEHWTRTDALALIRKAYPFRDLDAGMFDDVLDYLAGGGASLRQRYSEVFGKIVLDADGFRTREGRVRREFLQNIGVIPNVGQVQVRTKTRLLGSVEESFIRQIKIGDVFMIAGRPVRLEKITQMEAWVTKADGALPTVPRWNANKMPLSNRVAQEINAFRKELRAAFEEGRKDVDKWIAKRLDCGKANAEILLKTHLAQHELSEIPTADFLLVEELEDEEQGALHYFFHSLIGRTSNDALARVITRRLSEARGGNAIATPHDYGFVLTVAKRQRFVEADFPRLLSPEGFDEALDEALRQSDMLKYHFRNAAQTGLMVYRNYFDRQKSVRKLQWSAEVIFNVLQQHEPEHVLMREARRDALQTFIDAEGAREFLIAQTRKPVRLRRVPMVPPLSFAMYATKIKEALLVEDPYETMERLYHQWWEKIENGPHPS